METLYDWATVAAFAGLVVLFLQRSTAETPSDTIWQYLPPAAGCALGNWLGNEGNDLLAILVLLFSAVYVLLVLKPFNVIR